MNSKDIAIPCRWQVKFRVKPSLNKSEVVDGYEFEVIDRENNNETYVTVSYETNAYDEKSPDSDKYTEGIMARKHASCLQNLLFERMIYQRVFRHSEIIIHSIPTLQNKKELEDASLWKPRNYVMHVEPPSLQIPHGSNSLTESHSFWKLGFQKKSKGYENDALRIADWLQRSEGETDEINSFIFAWIAFNGLYGLFASIAGKEGLRNDADKFEHIIRELLVNDAINIGNSSALNKLESYGILSDAGNTNWSDKLKTERMNTNKDDIKILQYAMRCVYGVRKQVFHEAPQPADIIERANTCKSILVPIAATCLRNLVNY